jgi:ribosomal protein S27AE
MARKNRKLKVLPFKDGGVCPYCSGTVQAHHGEVVECTGCGQLIERSALVVGVRA